MHAWRREKDNSGLGQNTRDQIRPPRPGLVKTPILPKGTQQVIVAMEPIWTVLFFHLDPRCVDQYPRLPLSVLDQCLHFLFSGQSASTTSAMTSACEPFAADRCRFDGVCVEFRGWMTVTNRLEIVSTIFIDPFQLVRRGQQTTCLLHRDLPVHDINWQLWRPICTKRTHFVSALNTQDPLRRSQFAREPPDTKACMCGWPSTISVHAQRL